MQIIWLHLCSPSFGRVSCALYTVDQVQLGRLSCSSVVSEYWSESMDECIYICFCLLSLFCMTGRLDSEQEKLFSLSLSLSKLIGILGGSSRSRRRRMKDACLRAEGGRSRRMQHMHIHSIHKWPGSTKWSEWKKRIIKTPFSSLLWALSLSPTFCSLFSLLEKYRFLFKLFHEI